MNHNMRSTGIWVSLIAALALTGLAALLLHAESPPAVQAGEASREVAIPQGAEPDASIIEVEWSRVHSGTLDGVFYDDLYWGGISSSLPTLVDIDDDGDLDLFVHGGNRQQGNNGELHFFRNDGTAAIPDWTHVTANYFGRYKQPVQFADMDADGDFDAVLAGWPWEEEGFIYYENIGTAAAPAWVLRTTDMVGDGNSEGTFTLVDINGDGDFDLFYTISWEEEGSSYTSIVFYENTGTPAAPAWTFVTDRYGGIIGAKEPWQPAPPDLSWFASIRFADIDADGDPDMFLGGSEHVSHYRNDGTASTPVWTFVTDSYGIGVPYDGGMMHYVVAFGDLDGNNTLDVVAGHELGWLISFRNTGTPSAASWELWVDGMLPLDYCGFANPALTDIDNDGDLDMILGLASPSVNDAHFVFLRNDGTRAAPLWTYVTGDFGGIDEEWALGSKAPTFVDIDGDGDQDLFIGAGPFFGQQDGTVYFYENTGTPAVAVFTLITNTYLGIVSPYYSQMAPAFADIDGDSDPDFFMAISSYDNQGQVHFYRNDGNATSPVWTHVTDSYMGIQARYLSFADADGDGDLDMFTDREYYRNDGNAMQPTWVLRGTPYGLAWSGGPPVLGDLLDDDGRPDLLLGGNGGVHLYRNVRGIEIVPPEYTADAIVVRTEPSATEAITRLEAGELDIYAAPTNNPAIVQQITDSPNLEGYISYGSYNELTFNPSGPIFAGTGKLNPFAVPRVRAAMNRLVDREYVQQQIMGGMSVPRWHALDSASRDYTLLADVTRALELEYAYNKTLAQQTIAQEMLALGATLNGGLWYYGGEPVEIILLIRTEDHRRQIGDYLGDQLESIGFSVIRDYKTSGEASPIWLNSDPEDGLFHIYTGGWVSTEVARDLSGNFAFFYTNMDMGYPLWQAYVNTPEFYDVASRLRAHDFASLEERRAMMAQALEWAAEDSVRVWLHDNLSITPRRAEVSYTSDLYGGMAGSWLWPHTLERMGSFTTPLTIGSPSVLLQPWNPLNGNTWLYDMMLIRATSDNGLIPDPYTGLAWPQRIEHADVVVQEGLPVFKTLDWVDLQFAPSIVVPADAWVDWDATAQRFLTAAEVYPEPQTALRKTVVTYPADLYTSVTWHDGSPFSAADVVLNMILAFDRYKEASPVYDPTEMGNYDSFMANFKGVRILSTNPLVIEHYSNDYQLDAENGIATWWPFYVKGPGAWHNLALGLLAEAAGTGAFSQSKADMYGVPQLDYVTWPGIAPLEAQLAAAQAANVIPYAPTLGQYVTSAQATARWANLANWHAARGHFWIGTGPLYLEHVTPVLGELSLKYYPAYPDAPDRWASFTEPAIPEVSVTGPDSIVLGDTVIYTVEVTFDGQPYPHTDIEAVRYLVLDSRDQAPFSGNATPVDGVDGLWHVILDADMTRQLVPGTNRLEVLAISKRVAVPGSAALTFTDAQPCYVRVSSIPDSTYHDLQTAIDAAQPGDVLKVAGTCTDVYSRPRRDLTTTGVVTQVAYIDKPLALQGGYTTTNWLTPNPIANPTTLSALGQGRVLYVTGGVNVIVDGFRITGGNAAGQGGSPWPGLDAGGGVYAITATLTLRNNRVFDNVASGAGGGLYLHHSPSTADNNTFTLNQAGLGGGLTLYESTALVRRNRVTFNTAADSGGGLYLHHSNAEVRSNRVLTNTAGNYGGGMSVMGGVPLVNANLVRYNEANYGGGLDLNQTGGSYANNVIADNQTPSDGAAIYARGATAHLLHSTIARNSGITGIFITDALPGIYSALVMTNTIIADHGAGIELAEGNTLTANTLLWHNTTVTVTPASLPFVTLLNDWTADPRFDADGYHLRIGSPAIDSGLPVALARDVDGDPRPYGLGFDVGADEAPYLYVPPDTGGTLVYTDTEGGETTLLIPPAAVSETTTIVLTQLDPETVDPLPDLVAGGIALQLDAYLGDEPLADFTFNELVTLTLTYTDEDVAGMDEASLKLYRYVCSGPDTMLVCLWEVIGTRDGEDQRLYTENNVLTAWLLGFSRFGTMGMEEQPAFEVSKTYASNQVAGMPVTYTLTVFNTGSAGATTVVLEDVIPVNLTWISGGTLALNRVRWTFETITGGDGTGVGQFTAALPCVAGTEIVNNDYRVVSSAQGMTSLSGPPVTFTVSAPAITVGPIQYTPPAPVAGEVVTFTATATTNGTPLSYTWSFGGVYPEFIEGTGPSASYAFPAAGTYTVTVTVKDACEHARIATATVTVLPAGYKVYLPLVMRE